MEMMKAFTGKVVLVTGGTSGIGRATAVAFAQEGASVVVAGRRESEGAESVALIEQAGGAAEFKAVDVTDREDMKAFIHFAKYKFIGVASQNENRVDVIFNNAGVMPLSPMNALKVEEWDKLISVNINGLLDGIAAGLPMSKSRCPGTDRSNSRNLQHLERENYQNAT
jgi:NADP-dependent 3-hydroxy acid dehydrogenase YdfG